VFSKNRKIEIYRTVILLVVLHGYGAWSAALRKKHRLKVSKNMVLRMTFGPKMDRVTVECERLHNAEHYDLYSSPNIIRVIKSRRLRWEKACDIYGRHERCKQGFGGKT
jgi:hypothetical protein